VMHVQKHNDSQRPTPNAHITVRIHATEGRRYSGDVDARQAASPTQSRLS
jgi:hypothetical protein